MLEHDGDTEAIEDAWQKNLVEKAEEYSLEPVLMGIHGGVWNYNTMGHLFRKTMGPLKNKLKEAGFQEIEPGVYDSRNWYDIRNWAKELAEKVR